jgi:hypothetical protein
MAAGFQAIGYRHLYIGQHYVGWGRFHLLQQLTAIGGSGK